MLLLGHGPSIRQNCIPGHTLLNILDGILQVCCVCACACLTGSYAWLHACASAWYHPVMGARTEL